MRTVEVVRHRVAIAGHATDTETGRAMAGVTVEITGMPAPFKRMLGLRSLQFGLSWESMKDRPDRTQTRPDGLFYFVDLPNGDYQLSASAPSYGARYGRVKQAVAVSRDAAGTLKPSWTSLGLAPTLVRGTIVSRKAAVTMAEVRVQGSGEHAFSDSQGKYVIAGIEPGMNRTLLVFAQGFRAASKPLAIEAPGEAKTVDFSLLPAPG
jgi:Carboxypeptidase regulatory-like domain